MYMAKHQHIRSQRPSPEYDITCYDLDAISRLSESFQQLQRESAGKLGLGDPGTRH